MEWARARWLLAGSTAQQIATPQSRRILRNLPPRCALFGDKAPPKAPPDPAKAGTTPTSLRATRQEATEKTSAPARACLQTRPRPRGRAYGQSPFDPGQRPRFRKPVPQHRTTQPVIVRACAPGKHLHRPQRLHLLQLPHYHRLAGSIYPDLVSVHAAGPPARQDHCAEPG